MQNVEKEQKRRGARRRGQKKGPEEREEHALKM